jgi:hypothetical protein
MGATIYAATDDAPFAVPSGVTLHYVVTVISTAQAINAVTDITTAAAHVVPSFAGNDSVTHYPKAVYLCCMDPAADVWMTWDGASPVVGTTQPIGVKLPPTYPALRVPVPAAIKGNTIKLRSSAVGGTPVVLCYEF